MLNKKNRILNTVQFKDIFKKSRKYVGKNIIVYVNIHEVNEIKFGFILSKKVGSSVERNLIKRRLRDISRESFSKLNMNVEIVVRVKTNINSINYNDLKSEYQRILFEAGVFN